MDPWLLAAGAAALVLVLALRLRGPGSGRDLTGPPRGRSFTPAEAARIGELVARGEQDEALRLIRAAGHDEAAARKLIGLVERLEGGGEGQ
jgi:hypothetical protein